MRDIDISSVLFGREINQILAYLRKGISVHLVGPRKSGRSRLLRELTDWLDDEGSSVLSMRGNSALQKEPLAAFFNTSIGDELAGGSLQSAISGITQFAGKRSAVLVCDDADFLDSASAGAIIAAHQATNLPVVTSSRPSHKLSADSVMLGTAPAIQQRVVNLEFSRLHDLVVRELAGSMEPVALAKIAMRSGGLFSLARAILITGSQNGSIVKNKDGIWTIPDDVWSDSMASVVEPFLTDVDPKAIEGATALASSGPVSMDSAVELLGIDVLRHLFDSGLAHYAEYGKQSYVGVFPPLLADYLVRTGSPLGRDRGKHRRRLQLGWPNTRLGTPEDISVISDQIEHASLDAIEKCKHDWLISRSPREAIALVVAMLDIWTPAEEVENVIAQTPITGEDDDTAIYLVWLVQWRLSRTGDMDAAIAKLAEYEKKYPRFDSMFRAAQAHYSFINGVWPTPQMLKQGGAKQERLSSDFHKGVEIEMQLAKGKTVDAINKAGQVLPVIDYFHRYLVAWECMALVFNGHLDEGIQKSLTIIDEAREQLDISKIESVGYVAVVALLLAGRLEDASDLRDTIFATTPTAAFQTNSHNWILSLGAYIAMWQGRREYSITLTRSAFPPMARPGPFFGMNPKAVIAIGRWIEHQINPGPVLWEITKERVGEGYVVSGIFTALTAVEYAQEPQMSPIIEKLLNATESPMLKLMTEYILAANNRDLDKITECIAKFTKTGVLHFAIRASVLRALLLHRDGHLTESAAQAAAAWEISKVSGLERAGFFSLLVDEVGLSTREYEVMELLATGVANGEAATILDMSVRTVETHLHNVARKVGMVGRESLIQAISTWLSPIKK